SLLSRNTSLSFSFLHFSFTDPPRSAINTLSLHDALPIYAQDHHPAVMPRKEPVEQGRAGSTDMQIAGGRRGKADTHARGVLSRLGHFERIFLGRINPSV